MKSSIRYLIVGLATAALPAFAASAPQALADCTSAGGSTICAQGEVRGGGPDAPLTGPAYPGYCADPWYCSDDWGVDVYWDPGRNGSNPTPPGINNDLPGRGGRPGGGGGGGRR